MLKQNLRKDVFSIGNSTICLEIDSGAFWNNIIMAMERFDIIINYVL